MLLPSQHFTLVFNTSRQLRGIMGRIRFSGRPQGGHVWIGSFGENSTGGSLGVEGQCSVMILGQNTSRMLSLGCLHSQHPLTVHPGWWHNYALTVADGNTLASCTLKSLVLTEGCGEKATEQTTKTVKRPPEKSNKRNARHAIKCDTITQTN